MTHWILLTLLVLASTLVHVLCQRYGGALWVLPCFTWQSASLLNNIPLSLTWPWGTEGGGGRPRSSLQPSAEYPARRTLTDSSLRRSVFISLSYFPHIHAHLRRGVQARAACSHTAVGDGWRRFGEQLCLVEHSSSVCSSRESPFPPRPERTHFCVFLRDLLSPLLLSSTLAFNDRSIRHLELTVLSGADWLLYRCLGSLMLAIKATAAKTAPAPRDWELTNVCAVNSRQDGTEEIWCVQAHLRLRGKERFPNSVGAE